MNRMQKMSWLMVISMGGAVVLSIIAVTVGYYMVGFPRAWAGLAFWGLGGIGGLGPLIFKKDPGSVQADERDHLICLKAARVGFASSYGVMGLLCMGIWEYCRSRDWNSIGIEILPLIWGIVAITAFFTHALAIVILYGRDNKAIEEANPKF
jgi:hypothetical protein